jgi:hypothetical protein
MFLRRRNPNHMTIPDDSRPIDEMFSLELFCRDGEEELPMTPDFTFIEYKRHRTGSNADRGPTDAQIDCRHLRRLF